MLLAAVSIKKGVETMIPHCPHLPPCDGCPRFAESGIAAEPYERLRALAERAQCELPAPVEGNSVGYRMRARLAVRGTTTEPKIGLFQERSHNIVDIPRCVIHHPLVNQAASQVKLALRETQTPPYHDRLHSGLVRYLQVVVERSTRTVQLALICNAETPESVAGLFDSLDARLGDQAHSLWFNGNTAKHNVILGPHWQRWSGPEAVVESIGGARVFYPPDAFGQANLDLFEHAVTRIHQFVPDGARVVEYHAGVGAIGLGLLRRARSLDCVELAAGGLRGLELGALELSEAQRARLTIHAGASAAHVGLLADADVVIVDPPRKGLEAALTQGLLQTPPAKLAYLSCGLDSFLRDVEALLASGRWRLSALEPYAFFPFTQHVETLALLERR